MGFTAEIARNLQDIHLSQIANRGSSNWASASDAYSSTAQSLYKPQQQVWKRCSVSEDCDNSQDELCAQATDFQLPVTNIWGHFFCLKVANLALLITTASSFTTCKTGRCLLEADGSLYLSEAYNKTAGETNLTLTVGLGENSTNSTSQPSSIGMNSTHPTPTRQPSSAVSTTKSLTTN